MRRLLEAAPTKALLQACLLVACVALAWWCTAPPAAEGGPGGQLGSRIPQRLRQINAIDPDTDVVLLGDGTGWTAGTLGTELQAWDDDLDDLAALTPTDSNIIVGNGTDWVTESGATARTSLGVAIGSDVQAWDARLQDIADFSAFPDEGFIVYDVGTGVYRSRTPAQARFDLAVDQVYDVGDIASASSNDDTYFVGDNGGTINAVSGAALTDLAAAGAVTADGEFLVGTGAGAFAYETGGTALDSIGSLRAHKASLETITEDTTLTADSSLQIPLKASTTYLVTCALEFDAGGTTPDIKLTLDPLTETGWSGRWNVQDRDSSGAGLGTTDVIQLTTAGASRILTGVVTSDTNADSIALWWAQNTSSTEFTRILGNSWCTALEL